MLDIFISVISCGLINNLKENANGFYQENSATIYLCKDRGYTEDTLTHEIGHHVYFEKLNERQRKAWDSISDKMKGKRRRYVSDYASTTNREDFAETYLYVKNGVKLQDPDAFMGFLKEEINNLNLKIKIMRNIIKKYDSSIKKRDNE